MIELHANKLVNAQKLKDELKALNVPVKTVSCAPAQNYTHVQFDRDLTDAEILTVQNAVVAHVYTPKVNTIKQAFAAATAAQKLEMIAERLGLK